MQDYVIVQIDSVFY